MRWVLLLSFLWIFNAAPAQAQLPELGGEIVQEPICFVLRNTATHKVYGNFATNYYMHPERQIPTRHRSNFRLDPEGSIDEEGYPADAAEFCSYGPFFEGRKLELVLRTLFPVFSCMTKIDQGEIIIKSERNASDSGFDQWAECYE